MYIVASLGLFQGVEAPVRRCKGSFHPIPERAALSRRGVVTRRRTPRTF
jgi:hypothetical protein